MIFYLIPLILIGVSLVIMIFVIVKKFSSLAAINIESIAEEKEGQVKNRIILERLGRNLVSLKKILIKIINPLKKALGLFGRQIYNKAVELEKDSLKKSQPLKRTDINKDVEGKLVKAEKFLANQDFTKAEEICISIIELDSKNLDAYELLTKVYLEKKEYKKARGTCRYLMKLLIKNGAEANGAKHRLANCYADLGLIYQSENKNSYALNNFQKAVEIEPHNPRFLDFLLKICIILKNKNLAQKAFVSLEKADPENQKLAELKKEIDKLTISS